MGQPTMSRGIVPAHIYLNGDSLYYIYLIKRVDENRYYLGFTSNLKRRFQEHNSNKGCKTTEGYKWKLIYYEAYETSSLARKREVQLKRNRGSKRALYNRLGIKFE